MLYNKRAIVKNKMVKGRRLLILPHNGKEYSQLKFIMNKKAVIAMSGGVDSSVAAYLMKEKGYECVGITIKTFNEEGDGIKRENTCCSLDDVSDAKSVAYTLGIRHFLYNFTGQFEEHVMKRFVEAYENGCTPNPCIDCNRYIKFQELYERAKMMGYDTVVTGHYARVERDENTGRYLLKKGIDANKDQSYVLYSLTQEQLMHTQFPLGSIPKPRVRKIAEEQGLINAHKHDSQDICFVTSGSYTDFIRQYTHKEYPEGDFVDLQGNILGRHKGIIHYTIGQRKGLGLSLARPMYVYGIDKKKNQVILSDEKELFSRELVANDLNLIAVEKIEGKMRVKAKVRYRHAEQPATVEQLDDKHIRVVFDEPQRAITKGQAVVLYDGDVVVGGATICECYLNNK